MRPQRLAGLKLLVIADPRTGRIVECNSAFEQLSGRKRSTLLGASILDYRDDSKKDRLGKLLLENPRLEEVEYIEYESTMIRADGSRLYLAVRTGISELDQEKVRWRLKSGQASRNQTAKQAFWP